MSPTAPTFVTLNDQLNKAHRRIRELQARETEAARPKQNPARRHHRTHSTTITRTPPPNSAQVRCPPPSCASDVRFGIGERRKPAACPAAPSPTPAELPRRRRHPARAGTASKRGGRRMFDLDPIGAMFLIIAVLWLIAAVAYGRDDR